MSPPRLRNNATPNYQRQQVGTAISERRPARDSRAACRRERRGDAPLETTNHCNNHRHCSLDDLIHRLSLFLVVPVFDREWTVRAGTCLRTPHRQIGLKPVCADVLASAYRASSRQGTPSPTYEPKRFEQSHCPLRQQFAFQPGPELHAVVWGVVQLGTHGGCKLFRYPFSYLGAGGSRHREPLQPCSRSATDGDATLWTTPGIAHPGCPH